MRRSSPPVRALRPLVAAMCAAAAVAGTVAPTGAQTVGVEPGPIPDALPRWMVRWSPLGLEADLARMPLRAPAPPRILSEPGPRSGAFWTAGNPAALGKGDFGRWSGFRLSYSGADDGFRRPLEPAEPRTVRIAGVGWQTVGSGVSLVGRVDVGREDDEPRSRSMTLDPYRSSPFIPVDTVHADIGVDRVRLEGGGAYHRGAWSFGTTLAYEAVDARPNGEPALPRLVRSTASAVSVGSGRELFDGSFWVGVEGRLRMGSENATTSKLQPIVVGALLHGFVEPELVGPGGGFVRRSDRDDRSVSLSAAGDAGRVLWTGFVRFSDAEDVQNSVLSEPSFEDRWNADGFSVGVGAHTKPEAPGLRIAGDVRWREVEGAAERHDLTGKIFRSRESVLDLSLDIRTARVEVGWVAGVSARLLREDRVRRDLILRDSTDIVTWSLGGALEIGRDFGAPAATVAYGVMYRNPRARLLNSAPEGDLYAALIQPALLFESTESVAHVVEATVEWNGAAGPDVWVRLGYGSVSDSGGSSPPTALLTDDRQSFTVSAGVTLSR